MSLANSSELVEEFTQFFNDYYDDRENEDTPILELAQRYPNEQRSLFIDWNDLYRYDWELAEDALTQPDQILQYAEEALRQYDLPIDVTLDADVRLKNLESVPETWNFDVGQYSADYESKLIALNGQVNKISKEADAILNEAAFECQLCGTLTRIPVTQNGHNEPHECQGCERQGPFTINWGQSELVDYQLLRLQLPPEKAHHGGEPASIDISIRGKDLVDQVKPGDRVTVATKLQAEVHDEDEGTVKFRGDANSIEHQETDYEDLNLDEYEEDILEIANSANPHQQVIDSIKPSHMGDENIKLAIALQMFGGVEKHLPDGSEIRGRSHILLVGDPGTDKSGLLEYARDLSPRAVYSSGQSSTKAGLTCAAVQDDFGSGGWTIEGGALVKAHRGLCSIDEFDKMEDEDQAGVMEAMSQGQISASKAGMNVELPAETTILAAANPEYGRFDQYEPIGEQIDLDPALFSRFDLIFTMTDEPDEHKDGQLANHMNTTGYVGGMLEADEDVDTDVLDTVSPEVEPELLRRYIAYAKKNVTPTLSQEARDVFKNFYTRLRSSAGDDAPVPITARKLEALHRLGEASARIRLSDTVTADDAELVTSIVLDCLNDVGVDPDSNQFDADIVETGTSKAQRERMKDIDDVIADLEMEHDKGAPIDKVRDEMVERGSTTNEVKSAIENLKQKGEVYEPNDGFLRTT